MNAHAEDNLVQRTTADYLKDNLGWDESVFAMEETFGPAGTLGRANDSEVVLMRYLVAALRKLNPGFADEVYVAGAKKIAETSVAMSLDSINREKHKLMLEGEEVPYVAADGTHKKTTLVIFDFYDESTGGVVKIIARNHQFLGVNRAVESVRRGKELAGKLGVFWHTQGSGKSYSMVFFARKVRRKLGGNYTFVVLTDRDELDTQIYRTFAGCGLADNDKDQCRATSGDNLRDLLRDRKSYVFSLIQKFNKEVSP